MISSINLTTIAGGGITAAACENLRKNEVHIMELANNVVTLIGNIFSCALILTFLIGLIYGIRIGYYTHYRVDQDALGQVIAELEAIRSAQRKPCDGPFYGCPESEYVRCKSYVPMEEREKTEDGTC